jgi:hypothetical protein
VFGLVKKKRIKLTIRQQKPLLTAQRADQTTEAKLTSHLSGRKQLLAPRPSDD